MTRPRVLIEDWLPAAAIGVECIRERSTGQQPPDKRLHVWWARRPLAVSRAAVLASLLPADFPRDRFERLLGFWGSSQDILNAQKMIDWAREGTARVENPHGLRAFRAGLRDDDLRAAHEAARSLWGAHSPRPRHLPAGKVPTHPPPLARAGQGEGSPIIVIDPMSGGGSIPLESARLGFHTLANEYNPVACTVLEATIDFPFRFGEHLASASRKWGEELRKRFNVRMERFYPKAYHPQYGSIPAYCYIFARTVPCPDTQHPTPLVPDWHLLKPKSGLKTVAVPVVDAEKGTWRVEIRQIGKQAGQLREPPPPTYNDGKGISLFSGRQENGIWQGRQIPADYIKAKALAGEMKSALYAVAVKGKGLSFIPPSSDDLAALEAAEHELAILRPAWEKGNIIPTELIPEGDKTREPLAKGIRSWADLFAPRQLLAMGVLVEELRRLRPEILKAEGPEMGEAVVHMLAMCFDKFANWNSILSSWNPPAGTARSVFDRHDFSFKATFCEMAPCSAGSGLGWAIDSALESYEEICKLVNRGQGTLPQHASVPNVEYMSGKESRDGICSCPIEITQGSATSMPQIADGSITAVVVDPPYADNVQYSELADFFYVWLKRMIGQRHPERFSTNLCENDQEAVVNTSRHREAAGKVKDAKTKAHVKYQQLMSEAFRECRRILRDDGVLTVMFTHKKQEAWEALFASLIEAGFTITATWPVKTEGSHSLHQAKKNAAQSTVILTARKRLAGAGIGYFDATLKQEIRGMAAAAAQRLSAEGLNPVDQLVGSFGPAMEVYSRYDEVRTDTGQRVEVGRAIDEAADAVSEYRIRLLADRGLEGVEAEGRFVLLCWDVLQAAEFRFNEARLLGNAVGMDVDQLVAAGLVTKTGDKIQMLSAAERRRERALEPEEVVETLFGPVTVQKRRTKKDALKVHPNDPRFRTALDGCHALALRYLEAGGGSAGVGSAKALARQQNWSKESTVARLMEALVHAAPEALRHDTGKKSVAALFPEFRAWHELLRAIFGMEAPDWTMKAPPQGLLPFQSVAEEDVSEDDDTEEGDEE